MDKRIIYGNVPDAVVEQLKKISGLPSGFLATMEILASNWPAPEEEEEQACSSEPMSVPGQPSERCEPVEVFRAKYARNGETVGEAVTRIFSSVKGAASTLHVAPKKPTVEERIIHLLKNYAGEYISGKGIAERLSENKECSEGSVYQALGKMQLGVLVRTGPRGLYRYRLRHS
jgi:hypothetical protein